MELSVRLQAVADLVTEGAFVADIGTDHAYIPIYLVKQNICKNVIAMDINKGPLLIAKEHIKKEQVEQAVTLRQSDGFSSLSTGEVSEAIIAGMGGGLVVKILAAHPHITASIDSFILQPQSEIDLVRRYLLEHDFVICKENMVKDDGKYYPLMKVRHRRPDEMAEAYEDIHFLYGKLLLEGHNGILLEYIKRDIRIKNSIVCQLKGQDSLSAKKRMQELLREIELSGKALGYWSRL